MLLGLAVKFWSLYLGKIFWRIVHEFRSRDWDKLAYRLVLRRGYSRRELTWGPKNFCLGTGWPFREAFFKSWCIAIWIDLINIFYVIFLLAIRQEDLKLKSVLSCWGTKPVIRLWPECLVKIDHRPARLHFLKSDPQHAISALSRHRLSPDSHILTNSQFPGADRWAKMLCLIEMAEAGFFKCRLAKIIGWSLAICPVQITRCDCHRDPCFALRSFANQ